MCCVYWNGFVVIICCVIWNELIYVVEKLLGRVVSDVALWLLLMLTCKLLEQFFKL